MQPARILILWNQLEEDIYEHWRRDGRRAPDWDPTKAIEPWETVGEEMELVAACVRSAGHEAIVVNIRDSLEVLFDAIKREKPDAIFNLIEWFGDDFEHEHHIPALFELANIEYTGNRPLALSLCQKKPSAKSLLAAAGIPVPRGIVVEVGERVPDTCDLRFPLIVKPAYEDASGGIDAGSVVHDRAALDARVAHILANHRMAAIVEEYIDGREIHCAILGNDPPVALPLFEMEFKGGVDDHGHVLPRIITYRAKWDPYSRDYHAVEGRCPPTDLGEAATAHIQDIAIRAFHALGCRDYARVDMRYDPATGTPYVLEVNPNPDLANVCAFAKSVVASGRTYEQAICEIAGYAVARSRSPRRAVSQSDTLLREYMAQRKA